VRGRRACGHPSPLKAIARSFLLATLALAKGVSLSSVTIDKDKWLKELFQRHFMSLEMLVRVGARRGGTHMLQCPLEQMTLTDAHRPRRAGAACPSTWPPPSSCARAAAPRR
jgi:hypothetical protein